MLIRIDFESEVPFYIQLRAQIIRGIALGQLKPGDALPSVRQFSSDLGINLHTVNKAYNILKQEGFVIIHRQKGVVVSGQMPPADEAYRKGMHADLETLVSEAACRGLKQEEFFKICEELFERYRKKTGESL